MSTIERRDDPGMESWLELNRSCEDNLQSVYYRLFLGLRNVEDPVTWRTTIVDLRRMLGVEQADSNLPDQEKFEDATELTRVLTRETWVEPLLPEILKGVGFGNLVEETSKKLDTILLNARHLPEPLLYTLAGEMNGEKSVAVVNPVGHYKDHETRIIGLHLTREVERAVFVASTQASYGGSYEVLARTLYLLRDKNFTGKIKNLDIVIPMFAGSRGHKLGQDETLGFEVLEARANPRILALMLRDIYSRLEEAGVRDLPSTRFISVDIHNLEDPASVFERYGFEFVNADPAPEIADEAYRAVEEMDMGHLPKKIISCDKGAIPRTERMVYEMLFHPLNNVPYVDMVFIDKERLKAGVVDKAEIVRVERWWKDGDGKVRIEALKTPTEDNPSDEECVVMLSDDMFDTGSTAGTDMKVVDKHYPKVAMKIFAATHPVLSENAVGLNRVNADIFIFGNTLKIQQPVDDNVRIVDMAPAIKRAILGGESDK